jgi:hypothetical protein
MYDIGMINAYILVAKPGEIYHMKGYSKREDNIKMCFEEQDNGNVYWIQLA